MIRVLNLPWTRNRTTWMWVAIAAVAFTSVARAETGLQSARGYSHPVLEFLARSQNQSSAGHAGALRFANPGFRRQANSVLSRAGSRALMAMLPVLFVGLILPLTLAVAPIRACGHVPAASLLSALFQRPPPSLA
jgi:hypothetical protein